jgi:hypothetical protein
VPDTERIDLKIKHLTKVEAAYRAEIKRAQADMRVDHSRKKRYERVIAKYQRKVDKLIPKVRHLREVRHRML